MWLRSQCPYWPFGGGSVTARIGCSSESFSASLLSDVRPLVRVKLPCFRSTDTCVWFPRFICLMLSCCYLIGLCSFSKCWSSCWHQSHTFVWLQSIALWLVSSSFRFRCLFAWCPVQVFPFLAPTSQFCFRIRPLFWSTATIPSIFWMCSNSQI